MSKIKSRSKFNDSLQTEMSFTSNKNYAKQAVYTQIHPSIIGIPITTKTSSLSGTLRTKEENLLSLMRRLKELPNKQEEARANKLRFGFLLGITEAILRKSEERFTSENIDLNITLTRLQGLLEEEDEEDDYGVTKPSAYAYGTALALVSEAARLMKTDFTRGSASTDDKGGIRLTWLRPNAEVRLVCAHQPDKSTYLYHEVGDEYGVEHDVSAPKVAHWLNWLNSCTV